MHGVAALLAALFASPAVAPRQVPPARAVRNWLVVLHLSEGLELLLFDSAGEGKLLAPGLHLIQEDDAEYRHQQQTLHGEALTVLDNKELDLTPFNSSKNEQTDVRKNFMC